MLLCVCVFLSKHKHQPCHMYTCSRQLRLSVIRLNVRLDIEDVLCRKHLSIHVTFGCKSHNVSLMQVSLFSLTCSLGIHLWAAEVAMCFV